MSKRIGGCIIAIGRLALPWSMLLLMGACGYVLPAQDDASPADAAQFNGFGVLACVDVLTGGVSVCTDASPSFLPFMISSPAASL
ncbi:hypothetical protein IMZ48_36740 [Candidatus Bathyarchaeota archaeon]|nr:hypothetical protein [Candidatus Bathyarchaeota archaeon]